MQGEALSTEPQRLLSADELAARWGVAVAHVYTLVRTGRLPAVRLGKYVRFSRAAIDEFERQGGTG